MRIVLDLQACQSGSRLGGIGRYAMALSRAMIKHDRGHEYWVILNSLMPVAINKVRNDLSDILPPDRILIFEASGPVAEAAAENIPRFEAAAISREALISKLNPDMVFVTSLFEGLYEEAITSSDLMFPAEKTAVILYDLIPLVEREKYLVEDFKFDWYMRKIDYLKKCGVILSISEFSRQEGLDLLKLPENRIVNMSSAIDPKFKPIEVSKAQENALRTKFDIHNDFIMFTGSFDQRKNHVGLIKAVAALPKELKNKLQIVSVGNGWDGAYNHLWEIAKSVGIKKSQLIFPGHVSDLELLQLYRLAKLFVFPSFCEGFGLPVLEAMSCGTPVIGSNLTSIPEVIGMDEALFNPHDHLSIRDKIEECLTNEKLYKKLVDHSLKQAANFSWEKSALIALETMEKKHASASDKIVALDYLSFDEALKKIGSIKGIDKYNDGEIADISSAIAKNIGTSEAIGVIRNSIAKDTKIGWLTTWNTRCGIATYTIPVRAAIPCKQIMFAPYADQLTENDDDDVRRCFKIGGGGNIKDLIDTIEGENIDALIIQFNYGFYDFSDLNEIIKAQYEKRRPVFVIMHSTIDPNPEILDRKLIDIVPTLKFTNILVHTMHDVERLANYGLLENVTFMPLGLHQDKPSKISLKQIKEKKVIGTYGFALPNKGLYELLDAFEIVKAARKDVHLLMVNANFGIVESTAILNELKSRAKAKGLEKDVTIVGDYLANEESLGYLKLSDIIAIPYQSTSESSSGSARMSLVADRLVAVTPLPIFDDMKSATLQFEGITPELIAKGILDGLKSLEENDNGIETIRSNARLWVNSHGFHAIGRYIFQRVNTSLS